MYDCLAPELTHVAREIHPALRWKKQSWLRLSAKRNTSPLALSKAFAAATSLGFRTENLANGSVVILNVDLQDALMFSRRYPDLLAEYEPINPFCLHK
ncbi:hypothetical protein [Iodobacter fluviatilis]|jgi:hypothetical protein|uniref:Uncharacterized protein n=1 Tax=Iodobacter fluviatilis TaxID=537 RepID=A0A7G3G9H3_9NEIS|nr:hypothetical protein [Iodobacter fluviatilis]QBC43808.1 hypothetical protein C1H71_09790 [Iodobacter fluviatilis]